MAEKLLKLSQLSIVKGYVDSEVAKKFQSATYDTSTRTVKFFKGADTSGTPDFSFTLPSDVDISGKADKVSNATSGNLAGLDTNGNLTDSGSKASDFAPSTVLDNLNSTTTGSGSFVKSVSETKGVVTVELGNISASDVPSITLSKISDAGTAASKNVATTAIVEDSTDNNLVTASQVATFVQSEVADLEGVLHFRGAVTSTSEITDPEPGDIVVILSTGKEFIYVDSTTGWKELGDETAFVLKTTTIAGLSLTSNISAESLNTALGIEDMISDATVIDSVDTDNFVISEKELGIASGKQLVTTSQATKIDSIAVNTTNKSVTDGTNSISGIITTSDANVNPSTSSVSISSNTISGILTSSDYVTATDSEVQAIFGIS